MSSTFSISNALKNPANVGILRKHGVIYLDRGLIALNKPPGLVTQGTTNTHKKEGTIQVALDDIQDALGLKEGPFTVHRLDKQTTGLFILAPTTTQAKILSKAYAHRATSDDKIGPAVKKYLALVHIKALHARQLPGEGDLLPLTFQSNGAGTMTNLHLREPLQRNTTLQIGAKGSINVDLYINEGGFVSLWEDTVRGLPDSDIQQKLKKRKSALTDVEVLGASPHQPIALVGLQLHTGIKHQLRVTLGSFCRTPILGDDRYGNNADMTQLPVDLLPPNALMLHSSCLELQRYEHKYGFGSFKVLAPLPRTFSQACERAGIPLPHGSLLGGVWKDGHDVTDKLRVQDALQASEASREEVNERSPLGGEESKETGYWLLD